MTNSIRLSEKHGVNPAIPICYYCGGEKNEVILAGRMNNDREAPRNHVWDMDPCDACRGYMEKGIILISMDPARSRKDPLEPYRTGAFCVVTDEAFTRIFQGNIVDRVLKCRWAYVDDETWSTVGLPRPSLDIAPAAGGAQ